MAQLNWQSSYDATALRWGLSYEEEGAPAALVAELVATGAVSGALRSLATPVGTVTIGAITPTSTGASIAFTYSDDDETGFEYRIDAGTAQAAGASSPLVIADLAASTEYDIEIRAINADGEGAWSSASTFETRMANPGDRATIVRKLSIVASAVEELMFSGVPSPIQIEQGGTYDLSQHVTGGTPPYGNYGVDAGVLPSGVSINSSTGVLTATEGASVGESGDITFGVDDSEAEPDPDPDPPEPGDLPTFGITSAVGGSDLPFAFGHVFAKGDVPSGSYVTASGDFACQPRNYWSDGSLKFAVISGRRTLSANTPAAITLGTTTSAPSGSNVAAVSAAEVGTTSVAHSVAGTVSLADAINGSDLSAFSGSYGTRPANAGRLRIIPGPCMTEEHFYAPMPSHGHMAVFWYVRKYLGGRIEIETVVENGWLRIASPAEVQGTVTVTVNGSSVYSDDLNHWHHARWSRIDWIGGDPEITPIIDGAYWRKTTLIPNYADVAPSSTDLNALVQTVDPLTRGPFDLAAHGGGYHDHLGLLPLWDAMYCVSGDARAYKAVLAAEQACNCVTMDPSPAGFAYRDEATLLPVSLPDTYTPGAKNDASLSNRYGSQYVERGTNSTAVAWTTDQAHGVAAGYLPYLLTGRWFSLETCLFNAVVEHLTLGASDASSYSHQRWMRNEDRGIGWGLRALSCALCVAPESIAPSLRIGLVTHLEDGMDWYASESVGGNNLGIRKNAVFQYNSGSYMGVGAFQNAFLFQSFAFGYQIAADNLDADGRAKWMAAIEHHGQFPVGLAGTSATYCYRRAGRYATVVGEEGTVYSSWADVWDAAVAIGSGSLGFADITCDAGSTLLDNLSGNSYWANYQPSIALAAELGLSGAAEAYARVSGASNFQSAIAVDWPTYPHFAVVPRTE